LHPVAAGLLQHGADPALSTGAGVTPLHVAASESSLEMAELLVPRLQPEQVDATANGKTTPLLLVSDRPPKGDDQEIARWKGRSCYMQPGTRWRCIALLTLTLISGCRSGAAQAADRYRMTMSHSLAELSAFCA
jgi:hypothetical protein